MFSFRVSVPSIFQIITILFLWVAPLAEARMDAPEEKEPTPLTPEQVLAGIYQPFSGPLRELESHFRPGKNYVVWIHVPAEHPMDLRTSEMFRRWVNATPLSEFNISHNMVAFRCQNDVGQMITGATGMTGGHNKQEFKMLLKGFGLSIFFSIFTDGYLNPEKEVGDYVVTNLRNRGSVFAGFEVSKEQCRSMRSYLSQFVHHPSRPYTRFGLTPDPEKLEGGGCVTFASALLKRAGILEPILPSYYRTVEAAKYLFGGNIEAPPLVEPAPTPWLKGRPRSVSSNLVMNNLWNYPPSTFPGTVSLKVMDPEKMGYSLQQFAKVYLETLSPGEAEREKRFFQQSPIWNRVVVSANNMINPGREVIYERFPINDSFDKELAELGAKSRRYFRSKLQDGYRIRKAEVLGMPLLFLERP